MQPIAPTQKFADTPISSQAMNEIAGVKTPGEIALDFPWDITSPEGIIAFFGAKMQDTDKDLKELMLSQQGRNAASTAMKNMKTMLDKVGDGEIAPGSSDYVEFKRLAAEVEGSMGATADENSLKASLDAALAPGKFHKAFDEVKDQQALADFQKLHPGLQPTKNEADPNNGTAILTYDIDSAPLAINSDTAKALSGKVSAMTDSYQTANQIDMISVQNLVNQISQITSLASNIVHSFNEAAMAPIGNVK